MVWTLEKRLNHLQNLSRQQRVYLLWAERHLCIVLLARLVVLMLVRLIGVLANCAAASAILFSNIFPLFVRSLRYMRFWESRQREEPTATVCCTKQLAISAISKWCDAAIQRDQVVPSAYSENKHLALTKTDSFPLKRWEVCNFHWQISAVRDRKCHCVIFMDVICQIGG